MKLFSKLQLVVVDGQTGENLVVGTWPFLIGADEGCDLVAAGEGVPDRLCEIGPIQGRHVIRHLNAESFWLNGAPCSQAELQSEKDYSLLVGAKLLLFRLTKDPEAWLRKIMPGQWMVQHKPSGTNSGPFGPREVLRQIDQSPAANELVVFLRGATVGFFADAVRPLFATLAAAEGEALPVRPSPRPLEPEPEAPAGNQGSLTCPTCWLRFDPGDVKHVAVHEKLNEDSLLGVGVMKRFQATRFSDDGVALDPMGVPTMDIACPHCHRKLPPDFLRLQHHIISIVGAPTSGKSYFLSVFTHVLKQTLFRHFDAAFADADPASNASLTAMRDTLFGAATPKAAQIAKTHLEGDMYEIFHRHGRKVALPKPFIFNVQPVQDSARSTAFVFYDNAGEHFQPGIDHTRSPGIQHLGASAGIIFLFDPAYNKEFRRRLPHHPDPQLKVAGHADIQDSILAEARVLLNKLRGLDATRKLDTPLAVVVGKLDVWSSLLPQDDLANPVQHGRLCGEAIEENSAALRSLLLEVCPQIVAAAESMSSCVKYFPVSSFGCSPVELGRNKDGFPDLSPDPAQIAPILVEVPVLWLMSLLEPSLVPLKGGN